MKKAIFVLMLLAVVLCSCKKQTDFEVKSSGFRCDAHIEYNEAVLDAKIFVGEKGDFRAEITSPPALDGMCLEWEGENVTVSYLGIKKEIEPESIPYFNYAKTLRDILGELTGNVLATATGDSYTYTGNGNYGEYEIEFRADGFPIKLRLPSAGLTVTFDNFEYVS